MARFPRNLLIQEDGRTFPAQKDVLGDGVHMQQKTGDFLPKRYFESEFIVILQ